jgi:hypothetical protein
MKAKLAKLSRLLDSTVENDEIQYTKEPEKIDIEQGKSEIMERSAVLSKTTSGMRKSRLLESTNETVEEYKEEKEYISKYDKLYEMSKQLEMLTEQVKYGRFSATDHMNFDMEIKSLMTILDRLYHDGSSDDKDCNDLSERIVELSKIINSVILRYY